LFLTPDAHCELACHQEQIKDVPVIPECLNRSMDSVSWCDSCYILYTWVASSQDLTGNQEVINHGMALSKMSVCS